MTDWTSQIKEQNAIFGNFYKARDFKSLSEQYTEDCLLLPPGSKLAHGRQAAYAIFSSLPATGVDHVTLTAHEVIPSNQTATERGVVVLSKADGTVADTGKYVVIWRIENGKPRMYTDIWNSDGA